MDDERGTLILISPEKRLNALNSVREPESLQRPGLHAACLPWPRDREVAVVAADAANDVVPVGYAAVEQPIHDVGSVAMGLCLVDVCDFGRLRAACLKSGRWSLLFLVAPLRIRYGMGSPVTALAIF